jgi:hypothetical protein
MPIQSKTEPARVSASEWQNPGQALRGLLEGKGVQTTSRFSVTLLTWWGKARPCTFTRMTKSS